MNFDGSFKRESSRGGFGKAIRDRSHQVFKRCSGAIDCSGVYEVEVYAMSLDCRELLQLDAFDAIVKGDSFFATQSGTAAAICPWRLADWVEEIHYISRQLRCSSLMFVVKLMEWKMSLCD